MDDAAVEADHLGEHSGQSPMAISSPDSNSTGERIE